MSLDEQTGFGTFLALDRGVGTILDAAYLPHAKKPACRMTEDFDVPRGSRLP